MVVGTDDIDARPGLRLRRDKTAPAIPVERAGLTNGKLYGVKVPGVATEPRRRHPAGPVQLADLGSRVGKTGAELETDSNAAGVTRFLRPEDGSWDPTNPNVFYFVTTNAINAPSRLWRLTFVDVRNPPRAARSRWRSTAPRASR